MAKLRGVILAAGRGIRMGGETAKTLIPLEDKEPLLHYILEGLRDAGLDDLLVVTGFKADEVQAYMGEHAGDLSVTYSFNARYASWNNFHTVRVAIDQSPGTDLLVVNSDIIVPPDAYTRVASTEGDLVLAVQQRLRLDEEDMRVELDGNRVNYIGKDLALGRSHGEFCGVSLIRPEAARLYKDVATRWQWQSDTNRYYEDVYGAMLEALEVRAAPVELGEYAEVDLPEDVPAAVAVADRFYAREPAATPAE